MAIGKTNAQNIASTSPAFTGIPTAPTATSGTNTTQIATTAFVSSAVGAMHNGIGRNILDNWYFANPVNQRGQSSYSTSGAYTIDRWKLTSGSVTVGQSGITLNGTITQIFEKSIGVPVIASALLSNGTMITPTYNDTTKVYTLTATGQTIVAAKLEVGTKQTLAESGQLTEIPDYYDQLTCCQRYFYRMHLDAWQLMALGICSAARNIAFTIPFPRMHAAPTMSSPYTIDMWSSGGAWVQAQSFTVKYAEGSPNLSFDVYPNANATVGTVYSPVIQDGGYIDFNADL